MKKIGRPVGTLRTDKTKTFCARVTKDEYYKLKEFLDITRQLEKLNIEKDRLLNTKEILK